MLKVMIVDDDFLVRQGMSEAIPWADYGCAVVALACDGQEALELIPQAMPDLVFCDVVMPRMNGLALLSQLQAIWPWIKVVMVSAHDESPYIREALRSDAVDYLLKPFHAEDIAQIIRKVRRKLEGERITLSAQAKANPQAVLELNEHADRVQQALREM
ncbi:MAG TPA: response regulator, partial [Clostridia bacterium]|nr:response regulator [Clostridia bacterium]